MGIQFQKCVVVPQHGPFSLYIKGDDPSIAKLDFYVPQYNLWIAFGGAWVFMVRALGLWVQQPLSS